MIEFGIGVLVGGLIAGYGVLHWFYDPRMKEVRRYNNGFEEIRGELEDCQRSLRWMEVDRDSNKEAFEDMSDLYRNVKREHDATRKILRAISIDAEVASRDKVSPDRAMAEDRRLVETGTCPDCKAGLDDQSKCGHCGFGWKSTVNLESGCDEDSFVITDEWIQDCATSESGGWTYAQFEVLGLQSPPKLGWTAEFVGKVITKKQAEEFRKAGKIKRKGNR